MDFTFVKGIGDPYASWGFCGGPTGDFHIHRGEKTHDVYGSPMIFTNGNPYTSWESILTMYIGFLAMYIVPPMPFAKGVESIYIVVAM